MDEVLQELILKKQQIDTRRYNGLEKRAFSKYKKMKKRGHWYFFVKEFDERLEQELEEQHKNKRRPDNMAKYELECSMTKGFNRVAVNIREIEEHELPEFQKTIIQDCERLWKQVPHSDATSKKETNYKSKPENNQRVAKQTEQPTYSQQPQGSFTLNDIPFPTKDSGQQGYIGTIGQHKTLVTLVNQGKMTQQQVSNIRSYRDLTLAMDKAFGKK